MLSARRSCSQHDRSPMVGRAADTACPHSKAVAPDAGVVTHMDPGLSIWCRRHDRLSATVPRSMVAFERRSSTSSARSARRPSFEWMRQTPALRAPPRRPPGPRLSRARSTWLWSGVDKAEAVAADHAAGLPGSPGPDLQPVGRCAPPAGSARRQPIVASLGDGDYGLAKSARPAPITRAGGRRRRKGPNGGIRADMRRWRRSPRWMKCPARPRRRGRERW